MPQARASICVQGFGVYALAVDVLNEWDGVKKEMLMTGRDFHSTSGKQRSIKGAGA